MKKKADSHELDYKVMKKLADKLRTLCWRTAQDYPLETILALTCVLANEAVNLKVSINDPEDRLEQWILSKLRDVSKPLSDGGQVNFKDYINLPSNDGTGETGVEDPS